MSGPHIYLGSLEKRRDQRLQSDLNVCQIEKIQEQEKKA